MILHKYGVTLYRLTKNDIELVRRKRNSVFVRKFMVYQDNITPSMQRKWFKSINNDHHVFFIIKHGKKKIGLTNSSNINWKKKSAEGGIFLWDKDYINTPIPLIVSLLSFELFFTIFKIKYCSIKVLKNNERAIKFNEMFGFKRVSDKPNVSFYDYRLSSAEYYKKTATMLSFIQKLSGDFLPLNENDMDFSEHRLKNDLKLYGHLPLKIKKKALHHRPKKR